VVYRVLSAPKSVSTTLHACGCDSTTNLALAGIFCGASGLMSSISFASRIGEERTGSPRRPDSKSTGRAFSEPGFQEQAQEAGLCQQMQGQNGNIYAVLGT